MRPHRRGRTAPDRAAFYNSALVRYLDFNDSYLARHETCHPSDNLGAVLAACEYAKVSGKELLCALAVAYQVQCRLSDEAPVRARGFDHTTQGAFALAAGISRGLQLDFERTVNAIALCGTAFHALRVTRTGALSHWKGLAYPNAAFACTHAAFLAMRGLTGPREVFEGNKGFMETIAGPSPSTGPGKTSNGSPAPSSRNSTPKSIPRRSSKACSNCRWSMTFPGRMSSASISIPSM